MKSKILVIDDEPDVQSMFAEHFGLRGYEVHTASDGAEGLEVCRRVRPDFVLMDLKMKSMDGDRAAPLIRKIVPNAKIFIITAYQNEQTRKAIENLPIDGYYEKPISILELETKIKSLRAHTP